MPEYGKAVSFISDWDVSPVMTSTVTDLLKVDFQRTRTKHPEWGLPMWNDSMLVKSEHKGLVYNWVDCPLSEPHTDHECVDGLVRGELVEGKYEHQWGWYVKTENMQETGLVFPEPPPWVLEELTKQWEADNKRRGVHDVSRGAQPTWQQTWTGPMPGWKYEDPNDITSKIVPE